MNQQDNHTTINPVVHRSSHPSTRASALSEHADSNAPQVLSTELPVFKDGSSAFLDLNFDNLSFSFDSHTTVPESSGLHQPEDNKILDAIRTRRSKNEATLLDTWLSRQPQEDDQVIDSASDNVISQGTSKDGHIQDHAAVDFNLNQVSRPYTHIESIHDDKTDILLEQQTEKGNNSVIGHFNGQSSSKPFAAHANDEHQIIERSSVRVTADPQAGRMAQDISQEWRAADPQFDLANEKDMDMDTVLKERRGVVKRRSTPILSTEHNLTYDSPELQVDASQSPSMIPTSRTQRGVAHMENSVSQLHYQSQPQPRSPPFTLQDNIQLPEPRPGSSVSNQEAILFEDFDGVHYAPEEVLLSPSKQRLSRFNDRLSMLGSKDPNKNMVYYPAPVPMMLNLPPRLSKARVNVPDKRKSTAFNGDRLPIRSSQAPRDSLYLEYLEIKDDSAVATFENLLDVAASAPPSSEEHSNPKQSYRNHSRQPSKPHSSGFSTSLMDNNPDDFRDSNNEREEHDNFIETRSLFSHNATDNGEPGLAQDRSHDKEFADEHVHILASGDGDSETCSREHDTNKDDNEDDSRIAGVNADNEFDRQHYSTPSTLLAELEARKSRQRQRTKAIPLRFGTGLRSTLLELDAVAEVERQSRRKVPTTLAWQTTENNHQVDSADDDVPLGLLFAGTVTTRRDEAQRMPGLLAKREMEDNEPLSRRRERLKNVSQRMHGASQGGHLFQPKSSFAPDNVLAATTGYTNGEDETLANRRKRIQAERNVNEDSVLPSVDFSSILAAPEPDEETLGQRRKRLQAAREKDMSNRPAQNLTAPGLEELKPKPSFSDLLQMAPQRQSYLAGTRQVSGRGLLANELTDDYHAQQQQQQQLGMMAPLTMQYYPHVQQPSFQAYPALQDPRYASMPGYAPNAWNVPGIVPNGLVYNKYVERPEVNEMQPNIFADQRSRDMVERWRSSII